MITRALIETVENNGLNYRIRIPALHKVVNAIGGTPTSELPIATVSYTAGSRPNINIGDVVYVTFENDNYSLPVILGNLLNNNITSAAITSDSIKAVINTELPRNTSIGKVTPKEIQCLTGIESNIQEQIKNISGSIKIDSITNERIDEICV